MSKEKIGRLLLEASTGMHGEEAKILSDAWCDMARKNEELKSRISEMEKDAERWKTVLHHVGADSYFGSAFYVIRGISAPTNVMRGAVSQHFEKSIDAAMQGA